MGGGAGLGLPVGPGERPACIKDGNTWPSWQVLLTRRGTKGGIKWGRPGQRVRSLISLKFLCIWILASWLPPGVPWLQGVGEKGLFTSWVSVMKLARRAQTFSPGAVPQASTTGLWCGSDDCSLPLSTSDSQLSLLPLPCGVVPYLCSKSEFTHRLTQQYPWPRPGAAFPWGSQR